MTHDDECPNFHDPICERFAKHGKCYEPDCEAVHKQEALAEFCRKLCRFGTDCNNRNCRYFHGEIQEHMAKCKCVHTKSKPYNVNFVVENHRVRLIDTEPRSRDPRVLLVLLLLISSYLPSFSHLLTLNICLLSPPYSKCV